VSNDKQGLTKSFTVAKFIKVADPSALFSNTLSSFFPAPPAIMKFGLGFENFVAYTYPESFSFLYP
jgi:hypothetical protein